MYFRIKYIFVSMCCGMMFLFPAFSFAAIITGKHQKEVALGEMIQVKIFVDSQGESVNSIEIYGSFDQSMLSFRGYSLEESPVSFWVAQPKEIAPGKFYFAGIIPGGVERGYDPRSNSKEFFVATLQFVAKNVGNTTISFENPKILRNDGRGTPLSVNFTPISFFVTKSEEVEPFVEKQKDETPPLPFIISVLERSSFARSPRLVRFETIDKESGIHHYEVSVDGSSFVSAESPYPLPKKIASFSVTVRAFDFFDNVTEQTIVVPGERSSVPWLIIAFALICVVLYRVYFRKRVGV